MSQTPYPFTGTSSNESSGDTSTINPFFMVQKKYRRYHGYVSCIICIFGLSANIINLIVLTRKHMIKPVNCILAALATVDFLTMLTYIIYAVGFYIVKQPTWEGNHSYEWMCFMMIHNHFILISHSMCLWFTVYLSWLRYNFVCRATIGSQVYGLKKTLITILIIAIVIILVCVPNFFLYKVVSLEDLGLMKVSGFWIVDSNFIEGNNVYHVFIYWIYAVTMKFIPCILLTVFIGKIIYTMYWSSKKRKHLQEQSTFTSHSRGNDQSRTTKMLMAVVIICLVTEMPSGILLVISATSDKFFVDIYSNLGDILDVLVLLNSSVNFILYCLMSRQFRDTLRNLLSLR